MDVVDEFVARMVERGEVGFHALLDRPSALRYLSPEKLADFLEWRRKLVTSTNRQLH